MTHDRSVASGLTAASSLNRDIASAEAQISQWRASVVSPPASMPPPHAPSRRQLQIKHLRKELADVRKQLRLIKAAKDHEALYMDSVQDEQEREIIALRDEVRDMQRTNRNLVRRLQNGNGSGSVPACRF